MTAPPPGPLRVRFPDGSRRAVTIAGGERRVGRLLVLGSHVFPSKGRRMLRCLCLCGANKVVLASEWHVMNGRSKSCGCLRHEKTRGENHPGAELKAAEVEEIRARYRAGETSTQIARSLGLLRHHVWQVVTGRIWKSVPGACEARRGRSLLGPEAVTAAARRHLAGESVGAIARSLGLAHTTVSKALRRAGFSVRLPPSRPPLTAGEVELVRGLYAAGKSIREVSRATGVSCKRVRGALEERRAPGGVKKAKPAGSVSPYWGRRPRAGTKGARAC